MKKIRAFGYISKYTNYKVAETITAFGRLVHEDMIKLCSEKRFRIEVVFRFTDGILVKNTTLDKTDQFIQEARQSFNVEIEHKNMFLNTMCSVE
jgi:hypothetical protein